jgi:hypothetical protein
LISVVNIRTYGKPKRPYEVYIGRKNKRYGLKGSILQNGFVIGRDGTRDEVCDKYDVDLTCMKLSDPRWKELYRLKRIWDEHKKLVLICHCEPARCHGETVKHMIEGIKGIPDER